MITETTTIFVAETPSHGPQGGQTGPPLPAAFGPSFAPLRAVPATWLPQPAEPGPIYQPIDEKMEVLHRKNTYDVLSYYSSVTSPILIPNHSTLLSGCASAQPVLHWHLTRRTPWKRGYPGSKYIRNTVCEANYTFTYFYHTCPTLYETSRLSQCENPPIWGQNWLLGGSAWVIGRVDETHQPFVVASVTFLYPLWVLKKSCRTKNSLKSFRFGAHQLQLNHKIIQNQQSIEKWGLLKYIEITWNHVHQLFQVRQLPSKLANEGASLGLWQSWNLWKIHGLAEIPNAHNNTCCQLDVSTVQKLWEYDQHTLDPDELALYVQSIMIHMDSPSPKSWINDAFVGFLGHPHSNTVDGPCEGHFGMVT